MAESATQAGESTEKDEPEAARDEPTQRGGPVHVSLILFYAVLTLLLVVATSREVSLFNGIESIVNGVLPASPIGIPRRIDPPFVSPIDLTLTTTISFTVYEFAIFGATIRLFSDFRKNTADLARTVAPASGSSTTPAGSANEDGWLLSDLVFTQRVLAIPAAVSLAAGIALVSNLGSDSFTGLDATAPAAAIGFFTGIFIDRAYQLLGRVADRFLSSQGDEDDRDAIPETVEPPTENPSSTECCIGNGIAQTPGSGPGTPV